jgi:hypothetical protein
MSKVERPEVTYRRKLVDILETCASDCQDGGHPTVIENGRTRERERERGGCQMQLLNQPKVGIKFNKINDSHVNVGGVSVHYLVQVRRCYRTERGV